MYPSLRTRPNDGRPKGLQVNLPPLSSTAIGDTLMSLGDIEDYLRADGGSTWEISRLTVGIAELIERHIGRALVRREIVAEWTVFQHKGKLPYPPHGEIVKVERITANGPEEVDATDYQTRGLERKTIMVPQRMSLAGVAEEGLRVTYAAGYTGSDGDAPMPQPLHIQMLRDIKSRYDFREEFTTGTIVSELPDPSAYDRWRVYG